MYSLRRASDIILLGDLNVNLLEYKRNNQVTKFMDNLISNGLLPVTTHPTRLSSRTATLLDFISTSNINKIRV